MAVLFKGGFESQPPFVEFDDVTVQGSATADVVAQPYAGLYSGQFRVTPSPNYAISRVVKYIQGSKLHIESWLNIVSAVLPYNVTIPIVTLSQADPQETICNVQVEGKGGQTVWRVMARNGSGWVGDFASDVPLQVGWNKIDLYWTKDSVNGSAQIYLNNALIGEITGVDTSLFNVERAYFGVVYKADSVAAPGAETVDFTVTIDEITVSDIESAVLTYSSSPVDVSILINGVTVNSGESVQIQLGSIITIEAPVTSEGNTFLNWLVNNIEVTDNPANITITGNTTLTALYSPDVPPKNRYEEIAALTITIGTTILLLVSVFPTIIKGKS